jgi:hypothetical protein
MYSALNTFIFTFLTKWTRGSQPAHLYILVSFLINILDKYQVTNTSRKAMTGIWIWNGTRQQVWCYCWGQPLWKKVQVKLQKNCSLIFFWHFTTPLLGKNQSQIAACNLTFSPHNPKKPNCKLQIFFQSSSNLPSQQSTAIPLPVSTREQMQQCSNTQD